MMPTLQMIGLLMGGAVILYYGGDFVVKGSSRIARLMGFSQLVVGLTLVAFGTSLPELVVSLAAALGGREAMAVGNVVGSNVANVGLIIGLSASIFYITISGRQFLKDLNMMLGVSVFFLVMLFDGIIARWEGLVLFSGIILYTLYRILVGRQEVEVDDRLGTVSKNAVYIVIGILGLYFGARMFVDGAVQLAKTLGVTDLVIGMTIVAYGTSLPELATSLVAAYRKESEISLGNIIGSNLFNIMGVIGLVSIITPLNVDRAILTFELPIMIAFVLALYPVVRINGKVSRLYAIVLFMGYVAFLIALFLR